MKSIITLISLLIFSHFSQAKTFKNAYISFEMPESWKCVLEHTEWVCRNEGLAEGKEAIIVLTAKEVGPPDSFEAYTQHLSQPQTPPTTKVPSKVMKPPVQSKINDQIWIDGLHLGSEVGNYYTRYMATIKDRISILVTLSAHQNFYPKYSSEFLKIIQSLRVLATPNLLSQGSETLRPGSGGIFSGSPIQNPGMADANLAAADSEGSGLSSSGNKTKMLFVGLGVLLLALGIFVLIKVRK